MDITSPSTTGTLPPRASDRIAQRRAERRKRLEDPVSPRAWDSRFGHFDYLDEDLEPDFYDFH